MKFITIKVRDAKQLMTVHKGLILWHEYIRINDSTNKYTSKECNITVKINEGAIDITHIDIYDTKLYIKNRKYLESSTIVTKEVHNDIRKYFGG